jgi:hypothetical protein
MNPGGLAADFKSYFDHLPKEELKASSMLPPYIHILIRHCLYPLDVERERKGRRKCYSASSVYLYKLLMFYRAESRQGHR